MIRAKHLWCLVLALLITNFNLGTLTSKITFVLVHDATLVYQKIADIIDSEMAIPLPDNSLNICQWLPIVLGIWMLSQKLGNSNNRGSIRWQSMLSIGPKQER